MKALNLIQGEHPLLFHLLLSYFSTKILSQQNQLLTLDIVFLLSKEHSINLLRELYMKEQCSVTHNWHFLVVSSQIITLLVVETDYYYVVETDYYYHCSSDTLDKGLSPVLYITEPKSLCSWQ